MPDAHEQGDWATPQPAISTHEMPDSVGAELRAAREALGQDIDDVSGALKIRANHLDAIENGRFGDLPGQTYAIGFVRTYAKYLGLDAPDVVRRFKDEVVGLEEHPELVFRAPERDARMPFAVVAVVSLLLAVAIYALWFYVIREPEPDPLSAIDAPPSAVAGAPEASETVDTAAPSEQTAALADTPQPVAPLEDDTASGTAAEPEEDSAVDGVFETTAAGEPELVVEDDPGPDVPPQANGPVEEAVASAPQAIVIRAVDDSWIEIRADDGEIMFSRVLGAGETYAVPDRSDLSMVTGNAGAIQVTVNGTPVPSLGEEGVVRRDIELTAEALMAGPAQ